MPSIDFSNTLNTEQLGAVTHGDGPQLVLAGAGSGKTRVITYRIAWLVLERGVDPAKISAVTFTNKAAAEMRGRVEDLLGLYPLPTFVGTFHRFALRLLRAYGERVGLPRNFAILDGSDQLSLVKKAIQAENLPEKNFTPHAVLSSISGAKNKLLDVEAYERQANDFFTNRVARVYRRYQKSVRETGGVDFDDMIRLSVELLRTDEALRTRIRARTQHLLVDEFQDTNHAQLELIRQITTGQITAVGDEDQSIYRWRGAEIANILHFEKTFPGAEIHKLERNYRSTQNILDASGAVVAHNTQRRGKTLWTDTGAGERLTLYRGKDELDEARWVIGILHSLEKDLPLSEMAILVRTNAQTRALEEELLRRKMPYALIGGMRFYERAEIKDLVAYLRVIHNPHDIHSLSRIINRPTRGIGKSSHQALLSRANEREKSPWDVLAEDDLGGFPVRTAKALLRFHDLMHSLRGEAGLVGEAEGLTLPALLRRVIEVTAYTDLYQNDEDRSKLENISEFVSAAQEFVESQAFGGMEEDLLTAFLDHAALSSEADSDAGGKVSLMTLHAAKGLEFRAVVLPGLEEELLPHANAGILPEDVEEERRLLYVGMTRARERLYLSACRRRRRGGFYQDQRESRFLPEIPAELLRIEESPELRGRHVGHGTYTGNTYTGNNAHASNNVYSFFGQGSSSPGPAAPPRGGGGSTQGLGPTQDRGSTQGHGMELAVQRGSRVRHAVLGSGRVLQIEGSGEDARLVVYFDKVGRRKLLAKYAHLETL